MYFSFLEDYKIAYEFVDKQRVKSIGRLRHLFYTLPEFQIQEAINTFNPFPEELKIFYNEIGFGFMNRAKLGKFDNLFDPMTLIYTNNQINFFATPETADELKYYNIEKQLLFCKTISNRYIAIDRDTVQGKNKIYYRGVEIEDSLYSFLKHVDYDRYYLTGLVDFMDYEQEKKVKKLEKEEEKKKMKSQEKVKYLGGHRLIDKD